MTKYLSYNGLQRVVNHIKTLLNGKADTSIADALAERISAVENYGNHLYYGTYLSEYTIETLEQSKDNGVYVFDECPTVKVDDLYIEATSGAMLVCVTAGTGEHAQWKYACSLATGSDIDVDELLASANSYTDTAISVLELAIGNKVEKVDDKGLSTNDYTTAEKNKLSGISSGAEVNVQSDWSVTDTTSDAYIQNKPTIPTNTNQLVNGAGFVTSSGVTSVETGIGLAGGTITDTGTLKVNLKSGDTKLASSSNATVTSITSGRLYPVQADNSGYLAVYVPWTDNNTTALGSMTGTLSITQGGTGANDVATARTNLGIGTVGTLSYGSGTTTFLRNDGTWATPTDTNTHYSAYLYATNSSTGTSNVSSVTNGNLRLNLIENGSVRSSRLIKGAGGATVTTDTSGNIVVTGKVGTTTDTTFVPLAT